MVKRLLKFQTAFFVLTLSLGPVFTYSQDMLWEKSYGGIHAEYLFDAVPTTDYGFILAGSSLSGKTGNKTYDNNGNLDYWIWKMDENGDLDWQKSFGGSGSDVLQSVKLTIDGGFILAGNSNSPQNIIKKDSCNGGDDFWIIKLDAKGGEQWQKTIGGTGQEKLGSIFQTKDQGYILGGTSDSFKSADKKSNCFGGMDYWVIKLDKDGVLQWEKTFGGIYLDELRSIEQTADQGYILGGYSNSPASGNKENDNNGIGDYWIIKLDKNGEQEWQKVLGGEKDDQLVLVHQTYDGGLIFGGNSDSKARFNKEKGNGKGTDFWIVKTDQNGELLWQETYDFGQVDVLTSIVENKDHTFLLGGFAKSEANGNRKDEKGINDYITLKISETGERLWDKTVGSDGDDVLTKVIEIRDGGYLLTGTSNPFCKIVNSDASSKSTSNTSMNMNSGEQLHGIKNATDKANGKLAEAAESFNEGYDATVGAATDKINQMTDLGNDSPLKFGVNKPTSPLQSVPSFGSKNGNPNGAADKVLDGISSGLGGKKANIPPSRDKKTHYGKSDFWVVKLLDKDKPKVVKASIEAFPNPAGNFTNVIVGYNYEYGTATVFDLAGHLLQSFKITGRTVPIDLSTYPQGIYIVNIKTNMQTNGVKVIKN